MTRPRRVVETARQRLYSRRRVKRRLLGTGIALAAVAVILAVAHNGSAGRGGSVGAAGDPARGALVWVNAACGTCHAFSKAGSTGQPGGTAPNLDRWLVPNARRVGLPVALFAYRRIVWGGRGMLAYGTTLSAEELDDLVSFVTGRPFSAPAGGTTPVRPLPAPPPPVTVPAKTVARWSKLERLPKTASQGAAVFAKTGCLSCHTYLGSGKRLRGGADLSRIGAKGKSAAYFRRYVAQPYRFGNNLMPSYTDLGAGELGKLAAFLAASRGRR